MKPDELKQYIETDNKSGYKTKEVHIKNKFPELYEKIISLNIKNNWFTNLYRYIHNIDDMFCSECGKILQVKRFSIGYPIYCSVVCKNKNEQFRERVKKTCLRKYGVDNPSKSLVVKKKIKNKIYSNGKWYVETNEFKNKSKETCLRKYGVDSYSKLDEYHEKVKITSIDRYGVDSYNKTIEYKELVKLENLKKIGVESYLSTNEFREKTKKTNLEKYGVEHHTQSEEFKNNMKEYYQKKYNVDWVTQTENFKNKMINTMIEKYGELWVNYTPKYNQNSIIFLDMISNELNINIQHALNGGEKKFIRYWVDGYIEEYGICIEWDEKHHNSKRQKERDLKKEIFLKENFKCKIVRINEKEFLKNIEVGIRGITNLIQKIINI